MPRHESKLPGWALRGRQEKEGSEVGYGFWGGYEEGGDYGFSALHRGLWAPSLAALARLGSGALRRIPAFTNES